MGLVRFMTIFDDEFGGVLTPKHCKLFDISAPYTFFKSEGYSYLDNFNISSREYYKMVSNNTTVTEPNIPSQVFQYSYEKLRDWGYLAAFTVCPHGKWLPYYKEAVAASKRIQRTAIRHDDEFFHAHVINSKAFGIGAVLLANTLSRDFYHNRNSTRILLDYSGRYANSSVTLILTRDNTIFGNGNDLRAYKVRNTRVNEIDISKSIDSVRLDRFAEYVTKSIKKFDGRYAVSFGCNCDFAGNTIGRIEKMSKHIGLVCTQYGITTAHALGTNTLCIHLGEYV